MLCAISGEVPQVPVVSRKSGHVYERRLVEAYINDNGTEPTTGEALSPEDLIDVKAPQAVRPRPPTLTSIPALLGVFQEEWDAQALQVYTLQQNLAQARQELSTALYEADAAVRVIARLTRERDEAREALAKIDVGRAAGPNGDAMQMDATPLPTSVQEKIEATRDSLSKTRRKRPVPEDWATGEAISTYVPLATSEPIYPGNTVLAVHQSGELALVGGQDGVAGVISLPSNKLVQTLSVGNAITSGLWAGDRAVVSTTAGEVKVFQGEERIGSFSVHAGAATAVALHPTGNIVGSVGEDKTYILYDIDSSKVLTQVQSDSGLTCAQFHPDGHLIAAGGEDGQIKIFDVNSGGQAATFDLGAPVKTIFFSENGTWLAGVTSGSSAVSIWDLRKSAEVKSIETGSAIESISWDYTGQYLAAAGVGGVTVEQYSKATKDWSEVLKSAKPASRIAWGPSAQSLVAADKGGVVTTFGTATG